MIRFASFLFVLSLFLAWPQGAKAITIDGHRVKALKQKLKAKFAKLKPKAPDVKPVEVKPAVKPGVKDGLHYGPLSRLRSRFGRHRPSPDDGPSSPSHPSLKPGTKPEKLPSPKDKKPAEKPKTAIP